MSPRTAKQRRTSELGKKLFSNAVDDVLDDEDRGSRRKRPPLPSQPPRTPVEERRTSSSVSAETDDKDTFAMSTDGSQLSTTDVESSSSQISISASLKKMIHSHRRQRSYTDKLNVPLKSGRLVWLQDCKNLYVERKGHHPSDDTKKRTRHDHDTRTRLEQNDGAQSTMDQDPTRQIQRLRRSMRAVRVRRARLSNQKVRV